MTLYAKFMFAVCLGLGLVTAASATAKTKASEVIELYQRSISNHSNNPSVRDTNRKFADLLRIVFNAASRRKHANDPDYVRRLNQYVSEMRRAIARKTTSRPAKGPSSSKQPRADAQTSKAPRGKHRPKDISHRYMPDPDNPEDPTRGSMAKLYKKRADKLAQKIKDLTAIKPADRDDDAIKAERSVAARMRDTVNKYLKKVVDAQKFAELDLKQALRTGDRARVSRIIKRQDELQQAWMRYFYAENEAVLAIDLANAALRRP
ncbi:MAG: hypothetical protein AAGC70_14625 [Pseudomonadota bacterium]